MEEKIAFWSTLCYTFLITGMMIGFGLLFQKRPPKNMSMKNEKTWVFAHQYAGRIWFYSGIAGLCFSVITLFCFRHSSCFETVSAILMIAQLILLIGVIWPTERALRRTFDSFGNLKK